MFFYEKNLFLFLNLGRLFFLFVLDNIKLDLKIKKNLLLDDIIVG